MKELGFFASGMIIMCLLFMVFYGGDPNRYYFCQGFGKGIFEDFGGEAEPTFKVEGDLCIATIYYNVTPVVIYNFNSPQ